MSGEAESQSRSFEGEKLGHHVRILTLNVLKGSSPPGAGIKPWENVPLRQAREPRGVPPAARCARSRTRGRPGSATRPAPHPVGTRYSQNRGRHIDRIPLVGHWEALHERVTVLLGLEHVRRLRAALVARGDASADRAEVVR